MYKKSFIPLLLSATALWAPAQDLHKEITVERTVQPDLREAFRLGGIAPEISMPPITTQALRPAEYTEAGSVTPEAAKLPPAPWADSIPASPYRGYISIGYLPMYNGAGSAGINIINRPGSRLNIWGQADGYSYKGDIPYASDMRLGTIVASAGADGYFRLPDKSALTFGIKGMGATVRTPYSYRSKDLQRSEAYYQHALSAGASLGWEKNFGNVSAALGGGWENFQFRHNIPAVVMKDYTPLNEKVGTINASLGLSDEYTGARWLGVNIDWSILSSNVYPDSWYTSSRTVSEGNIRPYLNFDSDIVRGSIGVNLSVATGNSNGGVKVAPEANIACDVTDSFVLWARATGGESLNPMSKVFMMSQYVAPYRSYERSNVPFDIRGGFTYGPASGVTLEVNAGYAKARGILTPLVTIDSNGYLSSRFLGANFKCWYVGGRIAYAYGSLFALSLGLKTGNSDNDLNSWYEWYDGSKTRLDASFKVHPADNLDVEIRYLMRTDRRGITDVYPYNSTSTEVTRYISNLGNIGDLNLNATYRISRRLTVFASLDNILGKRYLLVSGMPAQQLGGLVGVAYKF